MGDGTVMDETYDIEIVGAWMDYTGPERRIHRVFVTRNSEYHLRRDRCVAVRERHSGMWLKEHVALGHRATASIRYSDDGIAGLERTLPCVGDSLYFSRPQKDPVVSSPVTAVERPQKDIVSQYQVN